MKFYVIGISGKQHAGKTTVATAVGEKVRRTFRASHIIKFAQPLYDMAEAVNRVLGVKPLHKDGKLMQMVGSHIREKYGENMFSGLWAENASNRLKEQLRYNDVQFVICDDMRYPNEALAIRSFADRIGAAKCLLVRLECNEKLRKERCPATWREDINHPSETGLDDFNGFDLTFDTEFSTIEHIAERIKRELGVE